MLYSIIFSKWSLIALVFIGLIVFYIVSGRKGGDDRQKNRTREPEIKSSAEFTKEMNEQRKKEGKFTIRPTNGDVFIDAHKDKSWNSPLDFYVKLAKGEGESDAKK